MTTEYTECHLAEHLVYGSNGAFCPCVADEDVEAWYAYLRRVMSGEQR